MKEFTKKEINELEKMLEEDYLDFESETLFLNTRPINNEMKPHPTLDGSYIVITPENKAKLQKDLDLLCSDWSLPFEDLNNFTFIICAS